MSLEWEVQRLINSAQINYQYNHGDTLLHRMLKHCDVMAPINQFVNAGPNVLIRNHKGRSPLHEAAKYSPLGARVIEKLLANGASVNSIDDEGSSILHDALKNTRIKLEVVTCLLDAKANPNLRDFRNIPPLGYVKNSSLSDSDKLMVEQLLIKYSVIKMFEDLDFSESDDDDLDPDEILCLHFCKDKDKRKEYANFRDSCIQEVLKMRKEEIGEDVTLFKMIYEYFFGDKIWLDRSLVKEATSKLDQNEYPNYEEMLRLAVKNGYEE